MHRYVPTIVGAAERDWILSDQFDGINWDETIQGASFEFFQGLDSPGGDYLMVKDHGLEELKLACLNTHHCLGFNTNGILKHTLQPPEKWSRWAGQKNSQHGLYVLGEPACAARREIKTSKPAEIDQMSHFVG